MGYIQKIKEFFRIKSIKKIDKTIENINNYEDTKKDLSQFNHKIKISKSQEIKHILRTIGCKEEMIFKISNIEKFDLDNMRKNLKIFLDLGYSKFKLNVIISTNLELLKMSSKELKSLMKKMQDYIEDDKIIADIIYSNPFIINLDLNKKIKNICEILEKAGFNKDEQKYILKHNFNIFLLKKNRILESLKIIKEYFGNSESFIEEVVSDPIIIGIIDKKVLTNHFSN